MFASFPASVTIVCSFASVFTPLPSSAVAAIAFRIAGIRSAVAPVRPSATRSARLSAGVGALPAAVASTREAAPPKVSISAIESTPVASWAPTTSLSSATPLALRPPATVAPTSAYCAAVGFTAGFASAAAPFASARITRYASTTAWISATVSVCAAVSTASAEFIASRLPAVTPAIPAVA